MKKKLKLVHSKEGQDIASVRRSNKHYKNYVKYRAKLPIGAEIMSFQEWIKVTISFNNRYL